MLRNTSASAGVTPNTVHIGISMVVADVQPSKQYPAAVASVGSVNVVAEVQSLKQYSYAVKSEGSVNVMTEVQP